MAFQIKKNDGILNVHGALNSENTQNLKQHFKTFLSEVDGIILSLENVTTMEPFSALSLEQIYLDFVRSNRVIRIIGRENRDIAGVMKTTKTSYILSDDRI
ncbi:hypothetical protein LCGC14_1224400 [marine sediment metagenome]|uniref:STAS domain-containing protein n=2 Tax=root TaxID=1 RepID=A0A831VVH1_9FLAO|nr:hypothetical protein [Pricia antarctica]